LAAPLHMSRVVANPGRPLALVVEDDAEIAAMLRDLLHEERWDVIIAGTVSSARRALAEMHRRLDLALLDQQLPDGRGLSLVSMLRRDQPQARIVVVTASSGLTRQLEGNLVDALFHKPMELKRFLAEVEIAKTKKVS
jgi:DNA-binding response OmpR family regulator